MSRVVCDRQFVVIEEAPQTVKEGSEHCSKYILYSSDTATFEFRIMKKFLN